MLGFVWNLGLAVNWVCDGFEIEQLGVGQMGFGQMGDWALDLKQIITRNETNKNKHIRQHETNVKKRFNYDTIITNI